MRHRPNPRPPGRGARQFRAKLAQENLIQKSAVPYSIVHATQFFEFTRAIADEATVVHPELLGPGGLRPPVHFGAEVEERSLVPIGDAVFGKIRYRDWA